MFFLLAVSLGILHTCTCDAGLFDFGNGKTGVNFLGFHASIGAGADGKLHADAGTPWGAYAGAGSEGAAGDGRLYAGATAGGDVGAVAGIGGGYGSKHYGASYAGASAGGKTVEVFKEKTVPVVSANFKAVVQKPVDVGVVSVVQPVHEPKPPVTTTVIQKTVIPNYEKKIVKVPSYEEKVVRVPTVIEKEVWVPAPPTIIEKEVQVPQPQIPVQTVPVFYKTKLRKHPHFLFRKHFSIGGDAGYSGGYAGGYAGGYGGGVDGTYSTTITKNVNPQFYDDVFNIPISTLGAVNKLLTGISSGASGSIDVSKTISASASGSASVKH